MADTDRYSDAEAEVKPRKAAETPGSQATAAGALVMNSTAFQAFTTGASTGGSEAWTMARLAGIQGAKQADVLILASHSFNIVGIEMGYDADEETNRVTVRCEVRTRERIGAETSALVGCGIALMVLVDALRAMDRSITVEKLRVVRQEQ